MWVTENTLDHVTCFDPVVLLTWAAAVTSKIRLGCSVVVLQIHSPLMVAHQWACLDYVSGGRAILGVGIGRDHHYRQFEVSQEGRVRRFREELDIIKALWTEEKVTYHGRFYNLENEMMAPKPVQKPHADLDGGRPSRRGAPRRAAGRRLDGLGRLAHRRFRRLGADPAGGAGRERARPDHLPDLETHLHGGRRAAGGGAARALALVHRRLPQPAGHRFCGIHGTPEQVRERLEEVVAMGANHLLLNPVSNHAEQVEALAEVVGLK